MKRLIPIFAIAALSGCNQPTERDMTSHMQTMMGGVQGSYTFLPHSEDAFGMKPPNGELWDLVVKLDQYTKTKDEDHFLCAHFNAVTVYLTPKGQYLLPYDRTVDFGGQIAAASRQQTEDSLLDFKTETLLNIPEYIDDKDHSTHKYKLMHKVSEVCVYRPLPVSIHASKHP